MARRLEWPQSRGISGPLSRATAHRTTARHVCVSAAIGLAGSRRDCVPARFLPPPFRRYGPSQRRSPIGPSGGPAMTTAFAETESKFRNDPSAARSTPNVTATLINGHARLSAGPFNWDADLPPSIGGGKSGPESDRVPARSAGGLRRRVPARHARGAVRGGPG